MPKRINPNELEAIVEAVSRFQDGASIGDIIPEVDSSLTRRTLQRRLAKLIAENKLRADGEKKGKRYYAVRPSQGFTGLEVEAAGFPISTLGRTLMSKVSKPSYMREPVGYNRDFLDSYKPNESFYLTESIRERLAKLGHISDEVLPAGTYVRRVYSRLLIDLSWNSSRLEGNTYSLLETERLLELGESAQGRSAKA